MAKAGQFQKFWAMIGTRACVALKVFATILSITMSGCATSSLRVVSTPDGADVSVIGPNHTAVTVGKTPLDIDQKNYPNLFQDSLQVQVVKEGHAPLSVLVPRLPNGASGHIAVNLQASVLPKVCQNQTDAVNMLAKGIADSASFVQRKRLDEAAKILEDLAAKFGTVSVIYDLLGNVYYLQKNLPRSLEAYRRSSRLNANNIDTIRMIERIEQLQGRSSLGE